MAPARAWAAYGHDVPRKPRVEDPGGIYHVTSRGNDKGTIFFDDVDFMTFLLMLERVSARHAWTVYAYCLMTNHYHVVVQIRDCGLSEGMKELNGGYARRTNARHGKRDHLFRNRFSLRTIGDDAHLRESCRYVVLNPVRARLCARPQEWRWSSYRACAGLDFAPPFLAHDALLRLFAYRRAGAVRAYRTFVSDGRVQVSDTVTRV